MEKNIDLWNRNVRKKNRVKEKEYVSTKMILKSAAKMILAREHTD